MELDGAHGIDPNILQLGRFSAGRKGRIRNGWRRSVYLSCDRLRKAAPESNQIIARTGSRQQFTKDPIEVLRGR